MRWTVAVLLLSLPLTGCLQQLGFGPDEVEPDEGWPDPDDALIQPGSRLYVRVNATSALQCTVGFIFQSPDNATLYAGFAAHCLGEGAQHHPVGTDVHRMDGSGRLRPVGDVVWDGWAGGDDLSRDFALVAIRNVEGARDVTHPAMKHWGGPTRVADSGTLVPGTEVKTYAASAQRAVDDPDNVKTGRFVARDTLPLSPFQGGQLLVRLEPPSIGGDSGSGLLLLDGSAVGVLSQGATVGTGGATTDLSLFVPLDEMLDLVHQDPDLRGVRLVTWQTAT